MKKRLFAFLAALVLILTPVVSALAEAVMDLETDDWALEYRTEAAVEGKTVPFIVDYEDDESKREREFTLYFVEGGDIPYVALSEYMPLLSEVILYGEDGVEDPTALYTVNAEGGDIGLPEHYYTVSRPAPFTAMVVDTLSDTIAFSNFNKFTQVPGVTALVAALDLPDPPAVSITQWLEDYAAAETDEERERLDAEYSSVIDAAKTGDRELFRLAGSSFNIAGDPLLIRLRDYSIDLVEKDGECYVPLQTMTDLFMSPFYLNFIYNGDRLYCLLYGSDLIDEVNGRDPEPMSEDFARFNYNELRLLLDIHYGLKAEHGITDFDEYFRKTGLNKALSGTDANAFDSAVLRLTRTYLDDGHSGFLAPSWRHAGGTESLELEAMEAMGPSGWAVERIGAAYSSARSEAYDGDIPMYEEVGDTAFITFDSFLALADRTEDYYDPDLLSDVSEFVIENYRIDWDEADEEDGAESDEDADAPAEEAPDAENGDADGDDTGAYSEPRPVDTIKLFLYAFSQITREDSPIRNVVIDLSNNGGGSAYAAIFVAAWILGRADIALRDMTTGAQTIMTYRADVNLDNVFNGVRESMFALDIKVYCMISPNSFSCGNLIPAVCKANYVTVIGQTSGGGSCAVLPCCSASGTLFQVSGSKQLSVVRNGSFYNIDRGIEPDIYLSRPEDYYDRAALVEYLHGVK